jgi:Fe-S-cluster-containing hydrogenase component 2
LVPEAKRRGFYPGDRPWVMVSLNDGEDPHFRKAEFNPALCPRDCPRPCERVCPADAIDGAGVKPAQCYGCGRCLPICPLGLITERSYVHKPETVVGQMLDLEIDAIEIHTQVGRVAEFGQLWETIDRRGRDRLKLIAVSCPDGEGLIDYLWAIQDLMADFPGIRIWQTDGRPMSGDIGGGATRACLNLGEKVLAAALPGYVQLAGGTNASTWDKARTRGLFQKGLAGIAYGSYARSRLAPLLQGLDQADGQSWAIETQPDLLWKCVAESWDLVSPLKKDSAL